MLQETLPELLLNRNGAIQGCGNSEPTAGHFGLFSTLLSCSHILCNSLVSIYWAFTSFIGQCP